MNRRLQAKGGHLKDIVPHGPYEVMRDTWGWGCHCGRLIYWRRLLMFVSVVSSEVACDHITTTSTVGTWWALVGFLTSVCPLVGGQVVRSTEHLWNRVNNMWLCVNSVQKIPVHTPCSYRVYIQYGVSCGGVTYHFEQKFSCIPNIIKYKYKCLRSK